MRLVTRTAFKLVVGAMTLSSAGSSAGCVKPGGQSGELVGSYAIDGALTDNTCGQAALPAKNPLLYTTELRAQDGAATWRVQKQGSASGSLGSAGDFHFQTQQTQDLGTTTVVNQDLQAGDLLSGRADPDLTRRHCILVTIDTLSGVVHKRLAETLDGGGSVEVPDASAATSDAGAGTNQPDLVGDETVQIMAATGADCSAALAIQGGPYTILPCGLHYRLEGTLQAAQ
jgi:hypothetical protein